MLSDADLASLGSIRKANPNHKDWQPMHLYLQSQVGGWSWQFGGDLIWLPYSVIQEPALNGSHSDLQVEEVARKKHGELDMIAEKQAAAFAARAAQSAKVRDEGFVL